MRQFKPGHPFGFLTVIQEIAPVCYVLKTGGVTKHRRFLLRCRCGKSTKQLLNALRSGGVVSCGCYRNSQNKTSMLTHGLSQHRIMSIWNNMMARCYRPSAVSFKHYGGRGIRVCQRWHTFSNFVADMGLPQPSQGIDRKNPDKNYTKSNCRWDDLRNCSSTTRIALARQIRFAGGVTSISRLARETGIPYSTLYHRIRVQNMSPSQALHHTDR